MIDKDKKESKILKVFETFSGIGSQHKALEFLKKTYQYNYQIVGTSEWDVDACISYAAIHYPDFEKKLKTNSEDKMNEYFSKFHHSFSGKELTDIKRIIQMDYERKIKYYKAHKISKNMGSIAAIDGKQLHKTIGDIDLITYSFPCQDLSVAGSFHGFNQGMKKGEGTRSSLLWEIGRILRELEDIKKLPKFLLLENVSNMLSSRHINDYIVWKKELYKMGYKTKTYILNAKDYGIPQNRKRVYAISVLGDFKVDLNYEITNNDEKFSLTEIDKLKDKKLKDILRLDYTNEKFKEEAILVRPNRTESRKRMFEQNYKLSDFDKYQYSRTVTTKQDRHPNAGVINLKNTILETTKLERESERAREQKPKANYRFITNREAYLLMGFDDKDYENIKKQNIRKEKMWQQAGNSIVVNVIATVILKIQELNNDLE